MSTTPHDALFKAVFSRTEHASSALRFLLPPAIAARVDFSALALRPGSFIDERLGGNHTDLLYSARTTAGQPLLIYILFEHQSTRDPVMPFRLLRYMLRIWDGYLGEHPGAGRLPPILPVVLHHSETGWRGAVAFEELLEVDPDTLAVLADYVPRFRFVLEDVSFESDEALRARVMTALGRLVLWCYRHARQPEELVRRLPGWRDIAREARGAPNGRAALALVWRYILHVVNPSHSEELVRRLLDAAGPEAEEEIVSVADYLEQKGLVKGHRRVLLKLLAQRFGALPAAVVERIQGADVEHLEGWLERVVTAATLEEVLQEG